MYMAHPAWPVAQLRDLLDRIVGETGASQATLAALVPIDPGQMSRWRSGKSRPSFGSLGRFADAVLAAYPSLSATKREILGAGGYADVLGSSPDEDVPHEPARIGPTEDWALAPPDGLTREQLRLDWNVDWDSLTLAERHAWHTPMVDLRTRYVMAATARAFLGADAEAYRMARGVDDRAVERPSTGVNGG